MEKMEVDEAVVDLSISSNNRSSPAPAYQLNSIPAAVAANVAPIGGHHQHQQMVNSRRVLRPRTEPISYVESPDVLFNGLLDKPRTNGNLDYSSDSSEGEMPPLAPIKELSPSELKHRERGLRRLREELRAEEMKLVLLKKLKQSQQLKENVAVLPPSIPPSALPPTGLPSGLSITPTTVKVPANKIQPPMAAHSRHPISNSHKPMQGASPNLLRGQAPPPRANMHGPPLSVSPLSSRTSLSVPQPPQRSSIGRPPSVFPPGVKDLSPSVTITPAPPQPVKDRPREDNQTPAQRQAAAKLALRKQLEKTLLQIPPPKPPPPEMHFIPNPSNTEFIYLVGLEHVVDFLTKETRTPLPPMPFACSQCQSDFTPVWKWESSKKNKGAKSVICEQCVTNNVKKALKAEHTNRLKTAFVKALQQEQEIEQRLAQNGVFTSSSPAPSPVTPEVLPKSVTPTPTPRHAATPPAPPPAQPTPPPPRSSHAPGHSASSVQDKYNQQQSAAAMQALHQQLLRSLSAGGPPAGHMLQFSPLLYPWQLAMAQAAASGKGSSANLAELQRAADLQRQYLLDMIPPGPQQRHNWKT
ncbi:transcriptional repressor p66-alpha isoform X2 [Anoplophora glabripennis]|uniref:transcriptional repressor p66-alpha isoform X2 n=1 Tax=Anoplophora glabripennis TaxID=217634 RepID=UPI0008756435|nr:transcriptional repressor p66-alpha isoform X2 [Anoplophora glabripennis]